MVIIHRDPWTLFKLKQPFQAVEPRDPVFSTYRTEPEMLLLEFKKGLKEMDSDEDLY